MISLLKLISEVKRVNLNPIQQKLMNLNPGDRIEYTFYDNFSRKVITIPATIIGLHDYGDGTDILTSKTVHLRVQTNNGRDEIDVHLIDIDNYRNEVFKSIRKIN